MPTTPSANDRSPFSSISAPISTDATGLKFHPVFVPHSAPAVLTHNNESRSNCVFEFHARTPCSSSGEGGGGVLPQRIYRNRQVAVDLNQEEPPPQSTGLHGRLQPVTEEQHDFQAPELTVSVVEPTGQSWPIGSPEYSSDSSQITSSDPSDFQSPPPTGGAAASFGSDVSLPFIRLPQTVLQESPLFFCFPQGATSPQVLSASFSSGGSALHPQVIGKLPRFFYTTLLCTIAFKFSIPPFHSRGILFNFIMEFLHWEGGDFKLLVFKSKI